MPMAQLQQFLDKRNENWFKSPKMYWHLQVFGSSRRGRTAATRKITVGQVRSFAIVRCRDERCTTIERREQ
jgi:hypothetical protein